MRFSRSLPPRELTSESKSDRNNAREVIAPVAANVLLRATTAYFSRRRSRGGSDGTLTATLVQVRLEIRWGFSGGVGKPGGLVKVGSKSSTGTRGCQNFCALGECPHLVFLDQKRSTKISRNSRKILELRADQLTFLRTTHAGSGEADVCAPGLYSRGPGVLSLKRAHPSRTS